MLIKSDKGERSKHRQGKTGVGVDGVGEPFAWPANWVVFGGKLRYGEGGGGAVELSTLNAAGVVAKGGDVEIG